MQESVIHEQEYTSRFDLDLWRKILAYLRPHRMRLVPFFALASTIALAEASFHLITRQVIDTAVRDGVSARLWPFAMLYLGLMVLIGFSLWGFIWLGGRISSSIVHEVRRRGFERLQELEFAYYDKRPVGWLMARLTSDCERLGNIITWGCLDLVWGMSMMGGIAAIMLWLDWRLALLVLAVVPVMAVVALYFQRVILASSRTVRKHNSRITAAYNEAIMGVETTKTLVREQANLAEFSVVAGEMRSAALRNAIQSALLFPAVITLGACGSALALWFGGEAVLAGGISLGTLVAFVAYSREFFVPISEMSRIFTELQIAQAAAERILGLIDTVPAIRDSDEVRGLLAAELSADQRHIARDGGAARIGTIELRDVEFSYVPGQPVLKHINLHVRAGERIALVGPTGGGKSTLVALLCRFYEPTSGQVLLDGVDYRQRSLAWLQAQLGIVLQVPHLFSGSVRENIRYGRLDATDAEIEQAARLVGAHDFIMEAEGGYDARIGQGGVNLSTGQKQLISFARAVLADPAIFVMDEATSSVDTPTEQLIQQGLQVVLHGRTSFIIAHRLSTIRSADRILVIRGGEITEAGTHHELLRLRGHYYRLYTEQFTEEGEQRLLHADDTTWATD